MGDITPMEVRPSGIDGLFVIASKRAADERGAVRELFRQSGWEQAGLPAVGPWMQINLTESVRGAVRGLHGEAMTKLVSVASGEAYGAYVDTRVDGPTFGEVVTVRLVPGVEVLVPPGVANGFQSVTDTQYAYCFDVEWAPDMTGIAVHPLDPALGIEWPIIVDVSDRAMLSEKDAAQPTFEQATGLRRPG